VMLQQRPDGQVQRDGQQQARHARTTGVRARMRPSGLTLGAADRLG
jgi:hypothetical protein